MRFRIAYLSVAAALVVAACSSAGAESGAAFSSSTTAPPGDTTPPASSGSGSASEASDASSKDDGGAPDGPPADAGADVAGAGNILGTHSGTCGVIASLLTSPSPALLDDELDFTAGETYDRDALSPDGQRMYDTENAGGSSSESEVMSLEDLRYCDGASLLHTETEIAYQPPDDSGANTITDYEASIAGSKVGVSVTRAYKPSSQTLTDADVQALLEKKLAGVVRSSQRVLPSDKWVKQVLHVWAATQDASDAVTRVWPNIDPSLKADTIVLVTRTIGGGFIYCHPTPPLGSECP